MSLLGSLNLGGSALATQQAALQVTGNNIANAGNADYSRQTSTLTEGTDQQIQPGIFVGTGVDLTGISRQVDDALSSRLRSATSDSEGASTTQNYLSQVESTFNALGDNNLSTNLDSFFQSWSTLANNPQDAGQRQVVIQDGQAVADEFTSIRSQLTGVASQADTQLASGVQSADTLATQIATLNSQIVTSEGGTGGQANALLDQRDSDLTKLSQLMDINTVPQSDGSVDVYVGSEPLITGNTSRGVALQQQETNGQTTNTVVFKADKSAIPITSGQLGATISAKTQVNTAINQLDTLAKNLIFELNKLHSSGQGLDGYTSVTATDAVKDPTAALGSAAAGLPNPPVNGSFVLHVKNTASGAVTSTLVQVDPTTTTLNSLQQSLSAIDGVQATISNGKLQISAANSGTQISFSQDSSGTLAALGVGSFFTGSDASNIAVNSTLAAQPSLLAAAKNGDSADNQTALAIASLGTAPVQALNGASLNDTYQSMINGVSTKASTATNDAQAAKVVQNTLQSQRDALSGVSLDEEAVNMIQQQRAYQGAAMFISTVNQMMTSLMNITV